MQVEEVHRVGRGVVDLEPLAVVSGAPGIPHHLGDHEVARIEVAHAEDAGPRGAFVGAGIVIRTLVGAGVVVRALVRRPRGRRTRIVVHRGRRTGLRIAGGGIVLGARVLEDLLTRLGGHAGVARFGSALAGLFHERLAEAAPTAQQPEAPRDRRNQRPAPKSRDHTHVDEPPSCALRPKTHRFMGSAT